MLRFAIFFFAEKKAPKAIDLRGLKYYVFTSII